MKTDIDPIVARYLKELERALADVPKARRREIVAGIAEHIEASIAGSGAESEAEVRNVLEQVGEPETIAAETRTDLGIERRGGGVLEGFAIAFLLVGGILIPMLGWVVGAVLLWVSRVWNTKDKLIGTLLVPGGLGAAVFFWLFVTPSSATCVIEGEVVRPGGSPSEVPVGTCAAATVGPDIVWTLLLLVLALVPIGTAIYLGRKAFRR